jgi:hypothetical protein
MRFLLQELESEDRLEEAPNDQRVSEPPAVMDGDTSHSSETLDQQKPRLEHQQTKEKE